MDGGVVGDPESIGISRRALDAAVDALGAQIDRQENDGAQLFVARRGITVLDVAIGSARPGVPLRTNSVMLWYSLTKTITSVAVGQLIERGLIELDSPIQKFIPSFGNGKESCTVRHVLTHTGGFPMAEARLVGSWDEMIEAIALAPAEWAPGTAAGYHPVSGYYVLGEVVRRVDGRPIEIYLEEEIFQPLAMSDVSMGLTPERVAELGDRVSNISMKEQHGPWDYPELRDSTALQNEPSRRARLNPGGNGYGPAHDLGRFFLALWNGGEWEGGRILQPNTVDIMTSMQRCGVVDRTFKKTRGLDVHTSWGFGFMKGADARTRATGGDPAGEWFAAPYGPRCTPASYGGAGGTCMTIGFVEPPLDLVMVLLLNALPSNFRLALSRHRGICEAIYDACR